MIWRGATVMRLGILGAISAALVALAGWWRYDAHRDAQRILQAEQEARRVQSLQQSKERRNATENLSADELRNRLGCRILHDGGPC